MNLKWVGMTLPDIKYELHDSVLFSIDFKSNSSLELIVELYGFLYKDNPKIKLVFNRVFSQDKVKEFTNKLNAEYKDSDEPNYLGASINCFQYDTKKKSELGDMYFFLSVGELSLRVHCQSFEFFDL